MAKTEPAVAGRAVESFGVRPWAVVFVLFLVQMANWVDKTVVSLAATDIMEEFGLSTGQYGMIGAAFYSLYAVSGLLVAFVIAPRFKARKILMIMLIFWSVIQLPVVFMSSFAVLVVSRTLLGMGEGAATPTTLNAAHEWFPDKERSMPTAIITFGSVAGAMTAAPVLTAIIQTNGWRAAFLACAAFGIFVLVMWLLVSRDAPYAAKLVRQKDKKGTPKLSSPKAGGALWRDPTLVGVTIVGLSAYWITAFQVNWLAPYLVSVTGDAQRAAWLLSLIFGIQAFCVLGFSYVSQVLLSRGVSSKTARGTIAGLSLTTCGVSLLALPLTESEALSITLVVISICIYSVAFPLYASIISEVAPPAERNRVMTIILSIVTLAAIPSSIATGYLIGAFGWSIALASNGVVAVIGAIACFLLVNPARSIELIQAA